MPGIAVFGGAFNPPHLGHRRLADLMRGELEPDKMLIIPSYISPQKSDNGGIDPVHRLRMCALCFDDPFFEISDMEIKRGGRSYTYDTLRSILAEDPDSELFLLIGSDMLLYFDKWYRSADLLRMCTLCAISRCGGDDPEKLSDYVRNVLRAPDRVRLIDAEPMELSSTSVRAAAAKGLPLNGMVAPAVEKYIRENGLYVQ